MKKKEYVTSYGCILNKMRKAYWKGRRKKYRDMIFYIINLYIYIHKGSHIKCVYIYVYADIFVWVITYADMFFVSLFFFVFLLFYIIDVVVYFYIRLLLVCIYLFFYVILCFFYLRIFYFFNSV